MFSQVDEKLTRLAEFRQIIHHHRVSSSRLLSSRVRFANLALSMEMIMRHFLTLLVLTGTVCVSDGAIAAARSDFTPTTPSSSQMLQCNSPDPARAIVGCSALIRTGVPSVRSRSSAAPLLGEDTAQSDLSAVYSTRGVAYQKRGEYDLALADFNQAIRLDPKNAFALRNRSDYYLAQDDVTHAMEDFNQAVAISPKSPELLVSRGNAYMVNGDFAHALPDYDQAIAINPKLAFAYASRGEAYRTQGESDKAITDFDAAIKLEAKLPAALLSRGLAREDKNDYTRAIEDFSQAIRLDPYYVAAYDERAMAYEHMGAHDKAMADVAQAMKLDPQNPDAHKLP